MIFSFFLFVEWYTLALRECTYNLSRQFALRCATAPPKPFP